MLKEKIATRAQVLIVGRDYTLFQSTDPDDVEAVQRLRYRVFSTEVGFRESMAAVTDGRDADRFDDFCDHLLVRHNVSGEVVGCYRMLPPPGAIAAGGLYTATEFNIDALDTLRPQMVEMGRATVDINHRGGSVLALMWSGILAYMDRTGYEYLIGCTSVPIDFGNGERPGADVRGIRDLMATKYSGKWTAIPRNPVVLDGLALNDIAPPKKPKIPPLLKGYLRIGAVICGEPNYDPVFGCADFVTVLQRSLANRRYLERLRSGAEATK